MARTPRSRWRLHRTSAVVLTLTVVMTALACLTTRSVMRRTEHRLLEQKAAEGALLLSSLMSESYGTAGRGLSGALTAHGVDQAAFARIAGALRAPGLGLSGVAVVDVARGVKVAGSGPLLADLGSDAQRTALTNAVNTTGRTELGFVGLAQRDGHEVMGMAVALGGGLAGYLELPVTGAVLESDIGPGQPFSGLDFAVYVGAVSDHHLLWTNKPGGRLSGDTAAVHADLSIDATYAGGSVGPLAVELSARQPLAGAFAMGLPWLLLPFGLLSGLVVMALTEATQRRRDEAVALVAELQERNEQVETAVLRQAEAEERLRQAQRLEAVGQLAGGVAHDFNNLLGVILNYAAFVAARTEDEQVRADIQQVIEAADRAAELTRQLLIFARRGTVQRRPLVLNDIVADISTMLSRSLGQHINIVVRSDPDAPTFLADRGQVEQVLVNLAVNARDAMAGGGTLMVESGAIDVDHQYAQSHPGLEPGRYAVLTVSDTGEGMAPEVVSHIFEPFFTTKGPGQGTGLGLSTVYGVATDAGGTATVYSEPGIGTTFRVYFPSVDMSAPADGTAREPAPAARGHGETILVVEDQPAMLKLTCRILEANGYRVVAASGPEDALRLAAEHDFDVLLTDLLMPEISGRDLVERIEALRPGRPVLYMSGYGEELLGSQRMIPEGAAFLQKPFTEQTLLETLQAVRVARRAPSDEADAI
jgi:signal transduction histidine kinase/ActR/RegA family two-component response regulator